MILSCPMRRVTVSRGAVAELVPVAPYRAGEEAAVGRSGAGVRNAFYGDRHGRCTPSTESLTSGSTNTKLFAKMIALSTYYTIRMLR